MTFYVQYILIVLGGFSRVHHHILPESALCLHICQWVTPCVWICLCWFGACLCVGLCVLWGWCGMEVSSVRSNIQANAVMWRALSRDNHQATQVQLPSVLFFLCGTHTNKHTHASCMLTHSSGKAPHGKSPRIVQSRQNKRYRMLVDCVVVTSYVTLHVTGKMGAMAYFWLN